MRDTEEWLLYNAHQQDLHEEKLQDYINTTDVIKYMKEYAREVLKYSMQQIKEKLEADYNILDEDICINEKDIEVFIISGKVDRIEKQILKDIGI